MTDWEKAKARLGEFLRVRGGTIPAQAEADIRSALEEVEDARSYAAEIAQGVSHYPHEEAEPCVRCRAERAEAEVGALQQLAEIRLQESMRQEMAKEQAEAEVARLQGSIASYQAAAHNYVNEHAEVARLKALMAERQEWRSRTWRR